MSFILQIRKKDSLFVMLYCVTMFVLLLDQVGLLPLAEIFRKIKYVYIIVMMVLCLGRARIAKAWLPSIFIFILLFIHTILFGVVITNKIVAGETLEHAAQMLVYLVMAFVTYYYIIINDSLGVFVDATYMVSSLQMLLTAFYYRSQFVNPLWGLYQTFAGGHRYKVAFGFVHPGYLSNACYFTLILSIIFWEIHKHEINEKKKQIILGICAIDGVIVMMLLSSAQRSGFLATVIALFIYWITLNKNKRIYRFLKVIIPLALPFIIISFRVNDVWNYIWDNSNRSLNISVNYPVFREIGNLWTGMGFVESSGFIKDNSVFGITTSSLDMYYVYIFFTTGIIGCVIIGSALIILTVCIYKSPKNEFRNAISALYISILFFAFWQCNLFTYRYVSSFFVQVLLLSAISCKCTIRSTANRLGRNLYAGCKQ